MYVCVCLQCLCVRCQNKWPEWVTKENAKVAMSQTPSLRIAKLLKSCLLTPPAHHPPRACVYLCVRTCLPAYVCVFVCVCVPGFLHASPCRCSVWRSGGSGAVRTSAGSRPTSTTRRRRRTWNRAPSSRGPRWGSGGGVGGDRGGGSRANPDDSQKNKTRSSVKKN